MDGPTLDPQSSINYLQVHQSNVFDSYDDKKAKQESVGATGARVFKKALARKVGGSALGPKLAEKNKQKFKKPKLNNGLKNLKSGIKEYVKEDAELSKIVDPPKVKTPRKKGKKKTTSAQDQDTEPSPQKVGEATDDDLRDTT